MIYPDTIAKSETRKTEYRRLIKVVKDSGLFEDCDTDPIEQYVIAMERIRQLDDLMDATTDPNNVSDLLRSQKIVSDRLAVLSNQLGLNPKARASLKTRKIQLDKQAKKTKYFT
jgi:P27 family predicted phage terminase small subunit